MPFLTEYGIRGILIVILYNLGLIETELSGNVSRHNYESQQLLD
jgi:hypothetical protein